MKTLLLLLFFGLPMSAQAADASKPHPHQGVLASYDSKPALPKLSADDLAQLANGKAVRKQSRDGQGGRGIAVQDINAPTSVVLAKISYFKNYPSMVDEVKLCEIYQNANGRIDDGRELFGPATGNGFAELAAHDEDGNLWIDESDSIYYSLRIWSKDAQGNDQLIALGQRGIGAIYLGHATTPFEVKNEQNQLQAAVRSSGIYLNEDGSAGTVQQLDLVV